MTTTLDDAKRILAAAEKRSVVVSPLPDVATAEHDLVREFLEAGAVGTVTGVECHRGHRGPTHAGWFYRKEIAGGGVLLDLGIYALTEIADLFGPAARLNALCATRFPQRALDDGSTIEVDVEDVALVDLWLKRGIAASIQASWNGYPSHHQTRTRATVYGREGMLAYGMANDRIVLHRSDGRYPEGGTPARLDGLRGKAYATSNHLGTASSVIGRFLERIAQQDVDLEPLRRQVHVIEEVVAAYAASRTTTKLESAGKSDLL
jgi:predicted dehydrogenase